MKSKTREKWPTKGDKSQQTWKNNELTNELVGLVVFHNQPQLLASLVSPKIMTGMQVFIIYWAKPNKKQPTKEESRVKSTEPKNSVRVLAELPHQRAVYPKS